MSMLYIGFDSSSKMVHSVALDQQGKIKWFKKWIDDKSKDFDIRYYNIMGLLWEDIGKWKDKKYICVIETPIYVQNAKATIGLAQMVGGIKWVLRYNNIAPFCIDNKFWKKQILGDGNASKEKILQFAETKWGKVFKEQDFADAACIALWGLDKFKDRL